MAADQSSFNQTLQNNIQNLKKKQRELELIAKVVDFVGKLPDEEADFKDTAEKVRDLFTQFSAKTIELIEAGALTGRRLPKPTQAALPDLQEAPRPEDNGATVSKLPTPQPDKLQFLIAWRHMDGKRVKIGEEMGTVRGCDAPELVVALDNGTTARVRPETLQMNQQAGKGK
jgi:hypothetical protein